MVKRSLQNRRLVSLFAIGDGVRDSMNHLASQLYVLRKRRWINIQYVYVKMQVTSTLTFAAACASAGITVLIDNDLNSCAQNHCVQFETSTALAFISWFASLPSFLFNFWSLASR